MEDEVLEQIRTRLAAATSAATALAKSLDALDESAVQTLECWLAKQEGDSKCGKCRALMPMGEESSVCISCGSRRPALQNTHAYDFKFSFALLQFLETIHPPLKGLFSDLTQAAADNSHRERHGVVLDGEVAAENYRRGALDVAVKLYEQSGSRKVRNPIVSTASGSPEPSASSADLLVERELAVTNISDFSVELDVADTSVEDVAVGRVEVAIEHVQQSKEDLTIDDITYPNNFQVSPPDHSIGLPAGEDGREADDFGAFQESWGDNAVETSHELPEDVKVNGSFHIDQFSIDFEAAPVETSPDVGYAAATTSGAGNTWDTEWDNPPSNSMPAKTQPEDNRPSDTIFEDSKGSKHDAAQAPDYDLSIFETFGGVEPKEENVLPDYDGDTTFWDFQTKNIVNSRLASVKAMERFASDTSAFTTITDADSDSGDSSVEALPPPNLPLDMLMEFGGNNGHNDLLGSLTLHEQGDFQRVAASSNPLATSSTPQDPFSWPLDTFDTISTQVVGGDDENVEKPSATSLETNAQIADDPFPWPLEEFDSGTTSVAHATIQHGSLDLVDPGRTLSEGNKADHFSWPVDTFSQIAPTVDEGGTIGTVLTPQDEVADTADEETEDWGDEEFVWSQAEPAIEVQLTSNENPLSFPSQSPPLTANFPSEADIMDKAKFFHDQSPPVRSVTNFSTESFGGFANLGNGLDSLVTAESEKGVVEEDLFKSVRVKSSSFGAFDKRALGLDNIDELLKRSVSFGNLQVKDMTEGDELLKVLQAPSIAPAAPAEDILSFLNLKPASTQGNGSATKSSHVRSVSFDKVELVPDEQSDEMFQFFHTRSHSAGAPAIRTSPVEVGGTSGSGRDIPSTPKTLPGENPAANDDPFSFIHKAISPSGQPNTGEVKAATNDENGDEDDDDYFEWKSAEMPASSPSETVLQPSVPTQPSVPFSSQPDIFQWGSPLAPALSPSKPLSGLLSLAGGLPPSQTRTPFKEDDLLAALSRNSKTRGVGIRQATATEVHGLKPCDDNEDEFSDFVSTGARPSAPLPTPSQQTSPPAFDVSFFEAAQPSPSEKRNLDFFGDLMGLNFTNA